MGKPGWRQKYPHLAEKYKEKERKKARDNYQKNKEKILASHKGNTEYLEQKRIYYNEWKIKNKEKLYETVYNWKATASGQYSVIRQNTKNRGIEVTITRGEFINWYGNQNKICVYCGLSIEDIALLPPTYIRRSGKKRLSVDRMDNEKGYSIDNIVLACYMCNTIKNSFLTFEEMKEVGNLVLKPKLYKLINKDY